MDDHSSLVRGRKVHSTLYGGRDGYILNYQPGSQPARTLAGGLAMMGGGTFDVVFEDGPSISRGLPEGLLYGPQWRIDPKVLDETTLGQMESAALAREDAHRTRTQREEAERQARQKLGAALFQTLCKPDTAAVIVARWQVDDCDIQTDYFNVKDDATQSYVLALSGHKRQLFAEMRKAVAGMTNPPPDLLRLAEKNQDFEHRENYSGGSGMYLKAGRTYGTGWSVSKIETGSSYGNREVFDLLGRGNYRGPGAEDFQRLYEQLRPQFFKHLEPQNSAPAQDEAAEDSPRP